MKTYYVYIMTNHSGTLFTGMNNNLERRVYEYKHKLTPGFTSNYNITKLVYFEEGNDVDAVLAREKQRLAACQENCIDRVNQTGMEGFEFGLGSDIVKSIA